jgi:hypothetical protein
MTTIHDTVNQICASIQPGDCITYLSSPRELGWRWQNVRTKEAWFIRLGDIKKQPYNELLMPLVLDFLQGQLSVTTIKMYLDHPDKIEKLKAFL